MLHTHTCLQNQDELSVQNLEWHIYFFVFTKIILKFYVDWLQSTSTNFHYWSTN